MLKIMLKLMLKIMLKLMLKIMLKLMLNYCYIPLVRYSRGVFSMGLRLCFVRILDSFRDWKVVELVVRRCTHKCIPIENLMLTQTTK